MVSHSHLERHAFPAPFYDLRDPLSNSAVRGIAGAEAYGTLEAARRGDVVVHRPIAIRVDRGRKLLDVVWISLVPVIHERVVEALRLSKVTGWGIYPVEIFDREERLIRDYHGLVVTGRCESMFLDKEHSRIVYEETSRGRFPYYRGLSITTDSWDGSDIFTAADGRTAYTIITERLRDLLVKAKITNVLIRPVSEIQGYAMDQPKFMTKP